MTRKNGMTPNRTMVHGSGIEREAGLFSAPAMIRLRSPCLLVAALAVIACSNRTADEGDLLLVTTTSVRDSGLLSVLLPAFQGQTGIRPQVIAVGI